MFTASLVQKRKEIVLISWIEVFYDVPLYRIYPQVPAAKTVAVLAAPLFAVGFSVGKFPGFPFG